jgi:hypothetical protein
LSLSIEIPSLLPSWVCCFVILVFFFLPFSFMEFLDLD